MPRIGSILNPVIDLLEIKIREALADRETIQLTIRKGSEAIDRIDKHIRGFEHALKVLFDESNKV